MPVVPGGPLGNHKEEKGEPERPRVLFWGQYKDPVGEVLTLSGERFTVWWPFLDVEFGLRQLPRERA